MVKRKNIKKQTVEVNNLSHGKLFVYLLLVIVAVFLVSKLNITGMSTKVILTPEITAGETLYLTVNSGNEKVEQQFDIYKYNDKGTATRFIDNYKNICTSSYCSGENKVSVITSDGWLEGEYSIRVYDWRGDRSDYTEAFFYVKGKYPSTDKIIEPQVHR